MKRLAQDYYLKIAELIKSVRVITNKGEDIEFYEGISSVAKLIKKHAHSGGKLIFIGNGASAAIASHQATDFWKNARIKATAFNDASLLTCISNDFGYSHVFEKPIEMFAEPQDILIAISSSGKSENILLGVDAAKAKGVKVITLSGFDKNNPLSKSGEVNFYVPSLSYGHVDIVQHSICHCLLEVIVQSKQKTGQMQ